MSNQNEKHTKKNKNNMKVKGFRFNEMKLNIIDKYLGNTFVDMLKEFAEFVYNHLNFFDFYDSILFSTKDRILKLKSEKLKIKSKITKHEAELKKIPIEIEKHYQMIKQLENKKIQLNAEIDLLAEKDKLIDSKIIELDNDIQSINIDKSKQKKHIDYMTQQVLLLYATDSLNSLEVTEYLAEIEDIAFTNSMFYKYLQSFFKEHHNETISIVDSTNKKYNIKLDDLTINSILNECIEIQ